MTTSAETSRPKLAPLHSGCILDLRTQGSNSSRSVSWVGISSSMVSFTVLLSLHLFLKQTEVLLGSKPAAYHAHFPNFSTWLCYTTCTLEHTNLIHAKLDGVPDFGRSWNQVYATMLIRRFWAFEVEESRYHIPE